MSNLNRRINTIEKRLNVGQHTKSSQPPIICVQYWSEPTIDQESLGLVETWLTYQEQLHAGQEANAELLRENLFALPQTIVIELDADKELQARKAKDDDGWDTKTN
jgi:hypothetical protein